MSQSATHNRRPRTGETITVACAHCSAPFVRYASKVGLIAGRDNGKFCSRKRLTDSRRTGQTFTCATCGGLVYRSGGDLRKNRSGIVFCSRACRVASQRIGVTSYTKVGNRHEHRAVAERYLNRLLRRGEVVHHIDHNRRNNDPHNLAVAPSRAIHVKLDKGVLSVDPYRLLKGGAACN